jgi:CBS domain-containing protein
MILLKKRRKLPLRAEDIMTQPPITTKLNTKLVEAAKTMIEKRIGSLLVVDEEGKLRGIITERDIVFATSQGWDPTQREVWEVMSENPITVTPDTDIVEVIEKMRTMDVRHMPVVDQEGKPVGVIASRDILDTVLTLTELLLVRRE